VGVASTGFCCRCGNDPDDGWSGNGCSGLPGGRYRSRVVDGTPPIPHLVLEHSPWIRLARPLRRALVVVGGARLPGPPPLLDRFCRRRLSGDMDHSQWRFSPARPRWLGVGDSLASRGCYRCRPVLLATTAAVLACVLAYVAVFEELQSASERWGIKLWSEPSSSCHSWPPS